MDIVDQIMAYENGELDNDQAKELFSELLTSGMIDHLQGHYQRRMAYLIANGVINPDGSFKGGDDS